MENKKYNIPNFDYSSLYPTTWRDFFNKIKDRQEKIKRIMNRINDKRTNKELSS